MTVGFPKGVNCPLFQLFISLIIDASFGLKFISVIIKRLELNLFPNTLKSSFVHCISKFGHQISLLPDFDPIQIAFALSKLGFNP